MTNRQKTSAEDSYLGESHTFFANSRRYSFLLTTILHVSSQPVGVPSAAAPSPSSLSSPTPVPLPLPLRFSPAPLRASPSPSSHPRHAIHLQYESRGILSIHFLTPKLSADPRLRLMMPIADVEASLSPLRLMRATPYLLRDKRRKEPLETRPRRYAFSARSPSRRLLIKLNENSINKSAHVWPRRPPLLCRALSEYFPRPRIPRPPPALPDRPGLPCPAGSGAPSPASSPAGQSAAETLQHRHSMPAVQRSSGDGVGSDGGSGCKGGGEGCGGAPFITSLSAPRDRVHLHPRGGGTCSSRKLRQQPST